MAPVYLLLRESVAFAPTLISTGQHRELLGDALALFAIEPDVELALMEPEQRLAAFFGRCVDALDALVADRGFDAIIAQGDTSSVLAAALAAFYRRRPFFHVEAGLRTGDYTNPFPEEMNRTLAGRLAALHFAPTRGAGENLRREGVASDAIEVTGNTVIDALHMVRRMRIPHGIPRTPGKHLIVVTAHRRESFGAPLRRIMKALATIAAHHPEVEIVYPAHPNPEVHRAIAAVIGADSPIRVVPPLPYGAFVSLLDEAFLVLTDSGGIQEEAPALGKPVLVLREDTERPEAIEHGVALLVGTDTDTIVAETERLLRDPAAYGRMAQGASPYGDGHAAGRIVARIARYFEAAPAVHPAR